MIIAEYGKNCNHFLQKPQFLSFSCPYLQNRIQNLLSKHHSVFPEPISRISVRPISNSQLRTLLHFHLCPINLIVFKGSWDISS